MDAFHLRYLIIPALIIFYFFIWYKTIKNIFTYNLNAYHFIWGCLWIFVHVMIIIIYLITYITTPVVNYLIKIW